MAGQKTAAGTKGSDRSREAQTLAAAGQQALRAGEAKRARDLFIRATALDGGRVDYWLNLAVAHQFLKDTDQELAALQQTLALEPRNLVALLFKGAAQERLGETKKASQTFNAALAVAPPFAQVPPDLQPLVRHAFEAVGRFRTDYEEALRDGLTQSFGRMQGRDYARLNQAVDIFLGKKQIFPQRPLGLFFPGLPTVQFYEREDFPWLAAIENETAAIRDEMLGVLASDADLVPYVDYPPGVPLDQWAELNHSHRWSVYHLWRDGTLVDAHAARCPRTVQAVALSPQARLPDRSPGALYSILKPKTRIPPHTGVTNVRLLVHVPLIVPENCGFRVGNDIRPWTIGEAFVFNDSIEHEAWNDSDQNRMVLIFDIWNPALTELERELVAGLFATSDAFLGTKPQESL